MIFHAREHKITFPGPALVIGILNVTPDSFSDGGRYCTVEAATTRAKEMLLEGADLIDVGGESTRPGAEPVDEQEELRRVIPVIEALSTQVKVPISIDTMKPAVAKAALAAGASIVNDVAANREDEAMWRIVADFSAGYVVMHMQGTPQTMQKNPVYSDVVREVHEFFAKRQEGLKKCGVSPEQTVLDVGIGFGKTLEHNFQLLGALRSFISLGRPMLLGVSRKSFIGRMAGGVEGERLPGALACTVLAAEAGVQMFRTHDVAATKQALCVAEAVLAHRIL